ncbi:MAG: 2-oxoacid:acceptor oxidoreductase family protein [Candidatus Gastranaerophilales bacterium]|nr:2-oxoacid:acceptor oxidoreductase family protein [Candidatus Gastranaerophilales bacterium]
MKLKSDSEKHLIIAGFGGQGVLFLGTTLAEAALIEGKNTTWMPSYGAEMRGGSANCYVIISDDEIPSPIFDEADYGVFLSKAAINKFEKSVTKGGTIIANSSMTGERTKRDDVNYILEPLSDIVAHSKDKALLNIMALGLLIAKTGVLTKESVIKALEKISSSKKPDFLKFNLESFEAGYNLANKTLGCKV